MRAPFDRALRQERRDFSRRLARGVHDRLVAPLISWSCGRSTGWTARDRGHRARQRSVLFGRRPADRLRDARRAETSVGGRRVEFQDLSPVGRVQRRELGPRRLIVFAQAGGLGLFRVPAAGGEPERIAAPDTSKGEANYLRPRYFRMAVRSCTPSLLSGGQTRIVARRLAGGDPMTVVESGFGAEYLASGHLLYAQDQRLMAVTFDPATLRTTGSPVPVQEGVSTKVLAGVANVAAAGDGTVVYISGGRSRGPRHIVWVDRRGTQTRALEQALEFRGIPGFLPTAGVSRSRQDDRWRETSGSIISRPSRPPVKLTFENHNLFPIWSPDGKRILFITRGRANYLNVVAADGSSLEPETLATNGGPRCQ